MRRRFGSLARNVWLLGKRNAVIQSATKKSELSTFPTKKTHLKKVFFFFFWFLIGASFPAISEQPNGAYIRATCRCGSQICSILPRRVKVMVENIFYFW
jgi:hypothetical protein